MEVSKVVGNCIICGAAELEVYEVSQRRKHVIDCGKCKTKYEGPTREAVIFAAVDPDEEAVVV